MTTIISEQVLPQGSGAIRHYRYYELEGYFADTWKATPNLTVSYGVRYSWYSVPYETNGLESVQDLSFNDYFNKRLQQSASGTSPATGRYRSSPTTWAGRPTMPGATTIRTSKDFAPRLAIAYNPSFAPKTVISAGFGVVFDHTIVNAVQYQQDQYSQLFNTTQTLPFGVPADPYSSLQTDPRFGSITSIPARPDIPVITHPLTPYVTDGSPQGLINGRDFNETIDRHLRNPYSYELSFGVQHEFPKNYILKLDYAGRLGRKLLAQADANQLIDFPDTHSGQKMSQAFATITQQMRDTGTVTPQPWFENVMLPGVGQAFGYNNNTELVAYGFDPYPARGDFADTIQLMSSLNVFSGFFGAPILPSNVGMGSQFSQNTFYTNMGSSSYHGLLAHAAQKSVGRTPVRPELHLLALHR